MRFLFYSICFFFTKMPSEIILHGNRRAARREQANTKYITRKIA
jgi:hypothetical protein